jgi:hypothetical protein
MKLALIAMVMLYGISVGAQTANVIELDVVDSIRAERVWTELQKAQADWNDLQKSFGERYTLVKHGDPDAGATSTTIGPPVAWAIGGVTGTTTLCGSVIGQPDCPKETREQIEKRDKEQREWEDAHLRYYRKGFESGFEFSKDFKYIVPKPQETAKPQYQFYASPVYTPCVGGATGSACWVN